MVAMDLSGSSGRSFLLLVTNLVLLVLGAIMIAAGSIISSIFLLHLLTFASQLFYITPILLVVSGALTILVAIFGLSLFKRKTEGSNSFMAYAGVIFVAMCIAVAACVTSFVLREAIAHRFSKTNVRAELLSYATDPIVRGRWDSLQYEYSCCGGYNAGTGYTDWEGIPIDLQPADGTAFAPLLSPEIEEDNQKQLVPSLSAVPDSCCLKMQPGCGKNAFADEVGGRSNRESSLSGKIHVNGCMTVVWLALYKHVMPTLMICALVALVVSLIELLLLLSACCFADHIRKLQRGDSEKSNSEKEGIIDSNEEAYSIHHEEKSQEYSLEGGRPSGSPYYDQDDGHNSLGSWYADSSSDGAPPTATVGGRPSGPGSHPHQLPMLEQSPSLRKNRYFFQSSEGVNENGVAHLDELNPGLESGKALLGAAATGEVVANVDDEVVHQLGTGSHSGKDTRAYGRVPKMFSKFLPAGLLPAKKTPKSSGDDFDLGRKEAMMEDALVRERTLMDVLKSVTRSKSRENVIEDVNVKNEGEILPGAEVGDLNDPVKKLPTIGRTIDRSRKYRPMENLSETPVKRKTGLDRLRKMKNDMFGERKKSKDGDEHVERMEKTEAGSIQFELQKTEEKPEGSVTSETSSTAELGHVPPSNKDQVSGTRERRESESGKRERRESESMGRERRESGSGTRERRESGSGTRERRESGSGSRERHESGSFQQQEQGQKPGHMRRPSSDGSGIPQLIREQGTLPQPKSILSQKSSISDAPTERVTSPVPAPTRNASARFDLSNNEMEPKKSVSTTTSGPASAPARPVRVSGFGVSDNPLAPKPKSSIRRSTRNLSLTSNPKLNTIHEPTENQSSHTDDTGARLRTRSLAPDSTEVQFSTVDPNERVPSRPSVGGAPSGYYFDGTKWRSDDKRSQLVVRSDDQLHRPPSQSGPSSLEQSRAMSASLSGERKTSTDSVHITRIKVEKEDENPVASKKDKKEEKKKEKEKEKKREKEKEKEKKNKEKEKEKKKQKKKKQEEDAKKRRQSSSESSDSGGSSDSSSDSDSDSSSDSSESSTDESSSSSDDRPNKKKQKQKEKEKDSDKKEKKNKNKEREKDEKKKNKKSKKSRTRSESPEKRKEKGKRSTSRKNSSDKEDAKDESKKKKKRKGSNETTKDGERVLATLEANTSPRSTPFPNQPLYDNVDVVRLATMVSPQPNWAKVQLVPQGSQPPSDFYLTASNEEPQEVAYYTTATLPSGASLRRSAYNLQVPDAPRLVPVSDRGVSEPRILVASNDRGATLDRYTMVGRSKSQERIPVKLRRQTVHQDTLQYLKVAPPSSQGVSTVAAASSGPNRARSVSMATDNPEGLWEVVQHQQNNPQFYRTSVEYDSLGEAFTVHQSASGRPVHNTGYKTETRKMTAPIMDQGQQPHIWGREPSSGRHHHTHHHTSEAKLVIHPSEELLYQQQQQRHHQPSYR